jgi:drug/metabolite transporter (DMT)-like permease
MFFGVIMGLAASASWAAANVFIARSSRAVGPFRAVVWAQIVGGVALAPIALALDHRQGIIDGGVVAWAAIAGVAAVVAYACLFFSMERGQLTVVVPVMSSWSVIAAGLSIGVLGETLRRTHVLGAGLVIIGVLLVSRFSQTDAAATGPQDPRRARGALLAAVGAAVGFGVLIPAIDRLTPVLGTLGAIPIVFLMDMALGVPLALGGRVDLSLPPRRAWAAVAAAGLFETAGFVWISLGASRAPVAIVSPLAGLASAFTVLFAWVVLGERPARMVLLGAAVACTGVVTLAL